MLALLIPQQYHINMSYFHVYEHNFYWLLSTVLPIRLVFYFLLTVV